MRAPRLRRLALVWLPLVTAAGVGGWLLVPTGGAAVEASASPTSTSASAPASTSPTTANPSAHSSTAQRSGNATPRQETGAVQSPNLPAPAGAGGVPAQVIYSQDCAACHGPTGRGTTRGPSLAGVGEAAVDFMLSTGRMPKKDAPSKMPPYSAVLPEADIKALDRYVTELVAAGGPAIPKVDPAQGNVSHGQELFDEECAACHGWGGAGGILFDRAVPKVSQATPTQVGEALRIGPMQMPKFGPHEISPSEVNDIAAYIQSLKHPADVGGNPISHLGPVAEGAVAWLIAMVGLILVARWIGERG